MSINKKQWYFQFVPEIARFAHISQIEVLQLLCSEVFDTKIACLLTANCNVSEY